MIYRIFTFLLISFLLFSCDILRFSRFEVISWSPGDGYHSNPENIKISLTFSHEPNKESAEKNFSLTGNGNRIRGSFVWEDKTLIFSPLTTLENNTDFILNLSSDTYNTNGLNIDETFTRTFTTRPANNRPVLISYYPSMYENIDDLRAEIQLEFSLPVPIKTLYDNVTFSPSMSGYWRLENNNKLAIFTPAEPWSQNTNYEIRVSSSLIDENGMNPGNEFFSKFTTQIDFELPALLNINRISKNGNIILLTPDKGYTSAAEQPIENPDWEKDDILILCFSKPVDTISLKNNITAENGPNLILVSNPGFSTEIIYKFETIPVYESRFTLRIKPGIKDKSGNETEQEYIYRFFANGKHSKPPSLAGIRMPMAPNNETDQETVFYGIDSLYNLLPITDEYYPSGESVKTWIELYFITADEASIDPFSLMELFRIETSNNVLSFSPRNITQTNFTIPEPQNGLENLQRIEISGNLVNTTNFGIVNFLITSGLRDNLGNQNDKQLRISLIK